MRAFTVIAVAWLSCGCALSCRFDSRDPDLHIEVDEMSGSMLVYEGPVVPVEPEPWTDPAPTTDAYEYITVGVGYAVEERPPYAVLSLSTGAGHRWQWRWFDGEELADVLVPSDDWTGAAAALYDWACSLDPQTRAWREWQASVFIFAPPAYDYENRNGDTAALLTALVAARGCE